MKILEEVNQEFYDRIELGYMHNESAFLAVQKAFKGIGYIPQIYNDDKDNASHIFYCKHVLFFGKDEYASVQMYDAISALFP